MSFHHVSVLLHETVDALNLKAGDIVVDATFGGGGHSTEVLKQIGSSGRLIAIDRDIDAIKNARTHVHHANYDDIARVLCGEKVDGILADLGLSSHQINTVERGFSYMNDAELDMRMDSSSDKKGKTAFSIVNHMKESELADLIYKYGEERYSRQIATNIVKNRLISTTLELAKICEASVPGNYYKFFGHPAKKTFQAIRIAVNDELGSLERFLPDAIDSLKPGGRIAIITFHSLEDRIVKQTFKKFASECLCPPKTPMCICGHKQTLKIVTKKPILPSADELYMNPRSASAKLRVAEKI